MVRLTLLGGASEIGGSCAVLEAFGLRVVVDAGLRPNARTREQRYPDFERIAREGPIDAILVTHAHVDHTGGLPLLHRLFPDVRIFATTPTVRIARTLLRDSVALMERDWEGDVDFTIEDIDALVRAWVPVDFKVPVLVASNERARLTVSFIHAGHIFGAAMLAMEFQDLKTGAIERVLHSGDFCLFDQPTIPGADIEFVHNFRPSLFVCEGTYGVDTHDDMAIEQARFVARVAEVLRRGGKVLIPAFAVGRAQNVALILKDAMENPARIRRILGEPDFAFPRALILMDGMCRTIADEYSAFRHWLRPELQNTGSDHIFYDSSGHIRPVRNPTERQRLLRLPGPMVIISSSGMLTGGPSVTYAAELAGDSKNAILLCGYQDEESPGRMLERLSRARENPTEERVVFLGKPVEVRCEVDRYNLSAHADANEIDRLVEAVQPLKTVLVHGTPVRLAALQKRLETNAATAGRSGLVEVGHIGETIEADGSERFDEPRFGMIEGGMPSWAQKVLTGRASLGASELTSINAWVMASLRMGRNRPLTDEEIARLDTMIENWRLLDPSEVAHARESIRLSEGLLWAKRRMGPETFFVPTLPRMVECLACGARYSPGDSRLLPQINGTQDSNPNKPVKAFSGDTACPSCGTRGRFTTPRALEGSLREIVHLTQERVRLQRRMSPDRVVTERERLRALGVGIGDLVLFVSGARNYIRLLAGVTLEEQDTAYRMLAPGASDSVVGINQIVARVGPWPWPSGTALAPSPTEVQLLDTLNRAISALAIEHWQEHGADSQIRDRGSALFALWAQVTQGGLSPLGASLGSVLLVSFRSDSIVQCRIEDLVALLGGPTRANPAMVAAGLRELVQAGLIQMRDIDGGIEFQWTSVADSTLRAHPDTAMVFQRLGPAFSRLLRLAFQQAMDEVNRIGLLEEYRRRNPFVFSFESGRGFSAKRRSIGDAQGVKALAGS